jgi:hypothetical protein
MRRLSFPVRRARKELAMSLIFLFREPCPRCGQRLLQAVIETHPTDRTIALHNLQCGDCGPVQTKVISLKPRKSSSKQAA